jgi:hypothetical protein
VAVALAPPGEAKAFCTSRAPSLRCLSDPTMASYAAYGLTQGSTRELLGAENWIAGMRATLGGHLITRETMNYTRAQRQMMPGAFAIDASGTVRAVHYARFAGDLPDIPLLLAPLGAAAAS